MGELLAYGTLDKMQGGVKMNYIVTGGAGFIGQKLVKKLLDTVEHIYVIDDLRYMDQERAAYYRRVLGEERVTLFTNYMLEVYNQLELDEINIDGVFHLASMNLLDCQENPLRGTMNNMGIMVDTLDYCCQGEKKKRLIFSSSASVYGNAVEEPMTESHPHNFENIYGGTKAACEDLFQAWYHKYEGFGGASLRYMNVYGPGMGARGTYVSVIIHVLKALYEGREPVVYGTGEECFDFIHVDDVVRANILCMGDKKGYQPYNVGTGVKTSINELVKMLMDITGKKSKVRLEPNDRSFAVTNRVCDPTSLWGSPGGWVIPLEIGLEDTVEWFDQEWNEGRM